jgi:hypothetical protein
MFKNFVKNLWNKIQNKKVKKIKKFSWLPALPQEQKSYVFGGITPKPKIGIL